MISIDNYDFKGKRALIRVDFNVPLNDKGEVTDDTRIRAAIPTIRKVLSESGSVILMSHMGRPKKNPDPKYSLEQIVPAIEKNLGTKVLFAGDCMGEKAAEMAKNLKSGEVLLLENLRFYAEEEGKPRGLAEDATKEEKDAAKKALKEGPQKEFVKKLASLGDCYVNDAFGTAHRKHASTYLIAKYFPNDKMFGYLMEREVKAIAAVMENPARPFCAIIGGSKVSSKIGVIKALIEKCDSIVIGGGMTYTFAAAQGGKVGKSICEPDMFPVALEILELAKQKGVKLVMSPDALIADDFSQNANTKTAPANDIPDGDVRGGRCERRGPEHAVGRGGDDRHGLCGEDIRLPAALRIRGLPALFGDVCGGRLGGGQRAGCVAAADAHHAAHHPGPAGDAGRYQGSQFAVGVLVFDDSADLARGDDGPHPLRHPVVGSRSVADSALRFVRGDGVARR